MRDVPDVLFAVEYRLIQMRNAPALRYVEAEQRRQRRGGVGGHGVLPCAERHEQLPVLVEREVAVHHRRYAGGTRRLSGERCKCGAQPGPDLVKGVSPYAVPVLAMPCVVARRSWAKAFVNADSFYPCRAKLDTQKVYIAHVSSLI